MDDELRRIATDPAYAGTWDAEVVECFRECIWLMTAATDENDLCVIGGFTFDRLSSARSPLRALAMTPRARLVVSVKEQGGTTTVIAHAIEGCHEGNEEGDVE